MNSISPGYWHYTNTSELLPCIYGTITCIGSNSTEFYGNSLCATEFNDVLCTKCKSSDNFFNQYTWECSNCSLPWLIGRLLLLSPIVIFIPIYLFTKLKTNSKSNSIDYDKERKREQNLFYHLTTLKILITMFQILSIIPINLNMNLLHISANIIEIYGLLGATSALSYPFSCWSSILNYTTLMELSTLIACIGAATLNLFYTIQKRRLKRNSEESIPGSLHNMKLSYGTLFFYILYVCIGGVTHMTINSLYCMKIDTDNFVLIQDTSINCKSTTYESSKIWAILTLLFFVFISIIWIGYWLFSSRREVEMLLSNEMNNKDFFISNISTYQFLFMGYNSNRYYWEVFDNLKRILYVGVLSSNKSTLQLPWLSSISFIMIALSIIYFFANIFIRPYQSLFHTILYASIDLQIIIFILCIGYLKLNKLQYGDFALSFVLLIVPIIAICYMIYTFITFKEIIMDRPSSNDSQSIIPLNQSNSQKPKQLTSKERLGANEFNTDFTLTSDSLSAISPVEEMELNSNSEDISSIHSINISEDDNEGLIVTDSNDIIVEGKKSEIDNDNNDNKSDVNDNNSNGASDDDADDDDDDDDNDNILHSISSKSNISSRSSSSISLS